jgi:hypothetical protein
MADYNYCRLLLRPFHLITNNHPLNTVYLNKHLNKDSQIFCIVYTEIIIIIIILLVLLLLLLLLIVGHAVA